MSPLCLYVLALGAASFQVAANNPPEVDGYVKHEGDCTGNDISQHVLGAAECAALCNHTPGCAGFGMIDYDVYTVSGSETCLLKFQYCTKLTQMGGLYFYTKHYEAVDVENLLKHEGDCRGHDIGNSNIDAAQCAVQCSNDNRCAGFVFADRKVYKAAYGGSTCYLKEQSCSVNDLVMRNGVYFYTPYYEVVDVENYEKHEGDCRGQNIWQSQIDAAQCAVQCSNDDSCGGFVFVDRKVYKDGNSATCYLIDQRCSHDELVMRNGVYFYTPYYRAVGVENYGMQSGDCRGHDVWRTKIDVAQCAVLCSNDHRCVSFVFVDRKIYKDAYENTCYLKDYRCTEDDLFMRDGVYYYKP